MKRIDTDKNLLEKIRENPPKSVSIRVLFHYFLRALVALWLSSYVSSSSNFQDKSMDAIEKAKKEGIDLTLLYKNLQRTPTERIENFMQWLSFAEELRRAKQKKESADVRH